MRKVIRSTVTGMFATAKGGGTADIEAAIGFIRTSDALAVARELHLRDVELYIPFDGRAAHHYNRTLPNSIPIDNPRTGRSLAAKGGKVEMKAHFLPQPAAVSSGPES